MYCSRCGRKQVDDAKFCFSCGAKIYIPEQKSVTPVHKEEKAMESIQYNAENDPYDIDLFDIDDEMPTEKPTVKKRRKVNSVSRIEYIIGIIVTIVAVVIVVTIVGLSMAISNRPNDSERYVSSSTSDYADTGGSTKSSGRSSYSTKSSDSSTNTCSMCGRSWKAGDSGGNYMSITLRNMCVSCYRNYQDMQKLKEALGY